MVSSALMADTWRLRSRASRDRDARRLKLVLRGPSRRDVMQGVHATQMQPHLDVLIVVAEAASENIDAPGPALLVVDADAQPDRVVAIEVEIRRRDIAEFAFAEKSTFGRDAPGRQDAVLRAFELPPRWRIPAAAVAIVTGAGPGADL